MLVALTKAATHCQGCAQISASAKPSGRCGDRTAHATHSHTPLAHSMVHSTTVARLCRSAKSAVLLSCCHTGLPCHHPTVSNTFHTVSTVRICSIVNKGLAVFSGVANSDRICNESLKIIQGAVTASPSICDPPVFGDMGGSWTS